MTILKVPLGCSAVRGASSSLMVSISVKCRRARASPLAASTASRRMIACAIDTVTVRSPSRTGIRRDASSSTICVSRSGGCAGALDVAPFGAAARIAGLAWREAMRLGRVTVPDGRVARPAGAAHGATAWPSAAAAPSVSSRAASSWA